MSHLRSAFLIIPVLAPLLVLGTVSAAHAEGIVLESYTGQRPANADKYVAPILEELGGKGYRGGYEAVGRMFESTVSRAAKVNQGIPLDFEQKIDQGHTAWTQGKFDDAVKILSPMLDVARINPGTFVDNERGSSAVLKGLIALALSQKGIGDEAAARATLAEIVRTFPNEKLSAGTYGTAANKLFESVRSDLASRGKGRLVIKPANTAAVVYLNERIDGVGTRTKDGLPPGEYRVMLQTGTVISRSHTIKLVANDDVTLTIDGGFDDAVRTKADWTGLSFTTASEREKSEARYAAAFGKSIRASSVAIIGIDQTKGRPSVIAALVNLETGGEIRRASIPLDASPSRDQLRGLAKFLAGEDAGPGIEVQVAGDPATLDVRNPGIADKPGNGDGNGDGAGDGAPERPSSQRWGGWKWMASGVALAGLGVGGYLLATNGTCATQPPSGTLCLDVRDNAVPGWIALGSGAALAGVAIYLFVTDGPKDKAPQRNAFVMPTSGGAMAGLSFGF